MPMLIAGKTMWNETVNANCNLARWNASKISMIDQWLQVITAFASRRTPCDGGTARRLIERDNARRRVKLAPGQVSTERRTCTGTDLYEGVPLSLSMKSRGTSTFASG